MSTYVTWSRNTLSIHAAFFVYDTVLRSTLEVDKECDTYCLEFMNAFCPSDHLSRFSFYTS